MHGRTECGRGGTEQGSPAAPQLLRPPPGRMQDAAQETHHTLGHEREESACGGLCRHLQTGTEPSTETLGVGLEGNGENGLVLVGWVSDWSG